jgi:hypothetical protein
MAHKIVVNKLPQPDDPVYMALIRAKLVPYLEAAHEWWDKYENVVYKDTGFFQLEGPPGWAVKVCRFPRHSPVSGIQVFPYVPVPRLQLDKMSGGVRQMIDRLIGHAGIEVDGMMVLCRANVTSTCQSAQFLAFVPKVILEAAPAGRWIYFTPKAVRELAMGMVPERARLRAIHILEMDNNLPG